jgi:L-tryptophan---pyruvate aminotransferase
VRLDDLDLRVGDPDFTRDYWRNRLLPFSIPLSKSMAYNPVEVKSSLRKTILELHNSVQNADTKKASVVLGVGATQVLMAALYALTRTGAPSEIFVRKPFYYRFPELIELSGCTPLIRPKSLFTEIVVLPNNPDNRTTVPATSVPDKIYDLCYNWPQYTITKKVDETIMVFSLSKCTGHASSRIGWALVKDSMLADFMNYYIEQVSGGPSVESMLRSQAVLSHLVDDQYMSDFFLAGRDELISRWSEIRAVKNPKFRAINNSGMFLWCEYGSSYAYKEIFDDLSILTIDGPSSGGSISQIRINVGCKKSDFNELIRRLNLPVKEQSK